MPCNHPELQFGSGDYYIFCHACHGVWARMAGDGVRPEYGKDAAGNPIGAAPEKANNSFFESDPYRRRKAD